jgi:protein O-GlcNAc transferase
MRSLPSEQGATAPQASEPPVATLDEALAQALAKARQCHQAGQLRAAEELYRAILQAQPGHAAANHGLGLLEVERAQPSAGLPHFIAALEADPQSPHHWLGYIDALLRSGQAALARDVLALGEQHGLDGAEVERLDANWPNVGPRGKGNKTPRGHDKRAAARAATHPAARTDATGEPGATEVDAVITLYQRGEYAAGEVAARRLTERHPQDGRGWKILGALLKAQGDDGQALLAMRRAVELLPDDAQVLSNLGLVLADLGQLAEAEGCHRRALAIRDDFAEAHYNLGNTLLAQRRHEEAAISYRQATQLRPDFALAHCNLGNALMELNRLPEAEAAYQRALALQANLAEAHNNLGRSLKAQGRLPEAETSYRRALALRPDYPEAFSNLGEVLTAQGRLGEGEAVLRQALLHKPDLAATHYNLGNNLDEQKRTAEAESAWQSAIDCQPDFAEAMVVLAASLRARNRLDDAEAGLRQAIACHPDLRHSALQPGQRAQSGRSTRRSRSELSLGNRPRTRSRECASQSGRRPDRTRTLYRSRCSAAAGHSAQARFARWHTATCSTPSVTIRLSTPRRCSPSIVEFGEMIEAPLRDTRQPHDNRRDPERRMQIGLVSGDFRNHAVANFIEPVLAELSGYQSVTLHAYYNHAHEDHVTQRLRQHFAHWQHVADLSDAELAKRIRADGIDILIDLSGHTAHNRLLTFAHKPAPIQASWIGYPGTTGLQSIDYFFADRHFLPAGEFDGQFTEQIVRLPASAPFLPFADAPDIAPLPALSRGHLTFGSFNRPTKIGPQVVALWSRLLRAVPEAKMLLGAMRPDRNAERLADEFAANGVARERLVFRPRCDMPTYLALYQQVDICLDTFPYTGGTTTLHACWMGVPTLTIAGRTVPGRAAASTLGHVGLPGFIAHDACEFVARGSEWAADPGQLAALRAGLRERLQQSALGRPGLVAAGLEGALRIIWQRWCQGLATGSFEVSVQDLAVPAAT